MAHTQVATKPKCKHERSDMIILIGGESHTGKTLLAQRLLESCHYPYLSLDHLKMGFIKGLESPPFSVEEDAKVAAFLWNITQGIITTCLENHQNLIIEGIYLEPCRVRGLLDCLGRGAMGDFSARDSKGRALHGLSDRDFMQRQSLSAQALAPSALTMPYASKDSIESSRIESLCVRYLLFSPAYIEAHLHTMRRYANVIESRLETLDASIDELQAAHSRLKAQCEKYSLPYVEIERDYTSEMERAFKGLCEELGGRI